MLQTETEVIGERIAVCFGSFFADFDCNMVFERIPEIEVNNGWYN